MLRITKHSLVSSPLLRRITLSLRKFLLNEFYSLRITKHSLVSIFSLFISVLSGNMVLSLSSTALSIKTLILSELFLK